MTPERSAQGPASQGVEWPTYRYAVLKTLGTDEDIDVDRWHPDTPTWSLYLHFVAGMADEDGGDLFALTVCSPAWLALAVESAPILDLSAHLVMREFSYSKLRDFIDRRVRTTSGRSWQEIAEKLSRFAAWEFADYQST